MVEPFHLKTWRFFSEELRQQFIHETQLLSLCDDCFLRNYIYSSVKCFLLHLFYPHKTSYSKFSFTINSWKSNIILTVFGDFLYIFFLLALSYQLFLNLNHKLFKAITRLVKKPLPLDVF